MKQFLKKISEYKYGSFGKSSSVSWLCANRNEQGEIISVHWGFLERDAFDPDELTEIIEKNDFKDRTERYGAETYWVVNADGLPTKFDPCKER